MRHLVFTGPGTLEWQTAPDPDPGSGQAVVRPLAVSRCDLDIAMAAFGIFPGPFPVGHEIAAEVGAVGPGVRRVKPGGVTAGDWPTFCWCPTPITCCWPRRSRSATWRWQRPLTTSSMPTVPSPVAFGRGRGPRC